jgi:hypothetical protein
MQQKQVTKSDIQELQDFVVNELKNNYSKHDVKNLNLPGLETILFLIASKVVIPLIVSITGRLAYDKISELRNEKEVIENINNTPSYEIPDSPKLEVVKNIVDDLEKDGIPEEQTKEIIKKTYNKLKAHINDNKSSS